MPMVRTRLLPGVIVLLAVVGAFAGGATALERVTLKIEGLTQTGCSSPASVKGTMLRTEGVTRAEVSRERSEAIVEFDPTKVDLTQLMAKVERFCLVKVSRPPTP
jgi:copper chaperone CopZ